MDGERKKKMSVCQKIHNIWLFLVKHKAIVIPSSAICVVIIIVLSIVLQSDLKKSIGEQCSGPDDCESAFCDASTKICEARKYDNGENCTISYECKSNRCNIPSKKCEPAKTGIGEKCSISEECASSSCDINLKTCQLENRLVTATRAVEISLDEYAMAQNNAQAAEKGTDAETTALDIMNIKFKNLNVTRLLLLVYLSDLE